MEGLALARSVNAGDEPETHGRNGPSRDDIRVAVHRMVELNAERKALNEKVGTFRKQQKARGLNLGKLDDIIRKLEWSPEEIKADHEEYILYAEVMRFPIGTQLEMFGSEATPEPIKDQLRWRNIGFTDGQAGRGWPDEPPEGCPPECRQEYGKGHEEGAELVRQAFLAQSRPVVLDPEPAEQEPEVGEETYEEDRDVGAEARRLANSGFTERSGDEDDAPPALSEVFPGEESEAIEAKSTRRKGRQSAAAVH